MKFKIILYLPLLLIIFQSCKKELAKPEFLLEEPSQISVESYEIYSLVINQEYTNTQRLVICQETKAKGSIDLFYGNQIYKDLVESNEDFDTSLVQTHFELNDNTVNFGEEFNNSTIKITLIPSAEVDFYFNNEELEFGNVWERFNEDYKDPGGLIQFSRIAFNEQKTQAIFEISHVCGPLCGYGSLVCLVKEDGNWIVEGITDTWIS